MERIYDSRQKSVSLQQPMQLCKSLPHCLAYVPQLLSGSWYGPGAPCPLPLSYMALVAIPVFRLPLHARPSCRHRVYNNLAHVEPALDVLHGCHWHHDTHVPLACGDHVHHAFAPCLAVPVRMGQVSTLVNVACCYMQLVAISVRGRNQTLMGEVSHLWCSALPCYRLHPCSSSSRRMCF